MLGRYAVDKIAVELIMLQPEEFIGVARMVNVKLVDEQGAARDFTQIWADLIDAIHGMNRRKRKNLLKLLRAANEGRELGGGNDAAGSED